MAWLTSATEVGPGFLPEESIFLAVTCGDVVIVQDNQRHTPESWWMGEVIHIVSGARGPDPSLFQVACIATGVITTVNADQVTKVVRSVRSQHQQNACISEKWAPCSNSRHDEFISFKEKKTRWNNVWSICSCYGGEHFEKLWQIESWRRYFMLNDRNFT